MNKGKIVLWYNGPYLHKGTGRYQMAIRYTDGSQSSMNYSRYLMEQKLGRKLKSSEHVDHIDEDKTNDDINNLQILTKKRNVTKSNLAQPRNGRKGWDEYLCPNCGELFWRRVAIVDAALKRGCKGPHCSRSCGHTKQVI